MNVEDFACERWSKIMSSYGNNKTRENNKALNSAFSWSVRDFCSDPGVNKIPTFILNLVAMLHFDLPAIPLCTQKWTNHSVIKDYRCNNGILLKEWISCTFFLRLHFKWLCYLVTLYKRQIVFHIEKKNHKRNYLLYWKEMYNVTYYKIKGMFWL